MYIYIKTIILSTVIQMRSYGHLPKVIAAYARKTTQGLRPQNTIHVLLPTRSCGVLKLAFVALRSRKQIMHQSQNDGVKCVFSERFFFFLFYKYWLGAIGKQYQVAMSFFVFLLLFFLVNCFLQNFVNVDPMLVNSTIG